MNPILAELEDAEKGWDRDDADWTEDLFHRAKLVIEQLEADNLKLRRGR